MRMMSLLLMASLSGFAYPDGELRGSLDLRSLLRRTQQIPFNPEEKPQSLFMTNTYAPIELARVVLTWMVEPTLPSRRLLFLCSSLLSSARR